MRAAESTVHFHHRKITIIESRKHLFCLFDCIMCCNDFAIRYFLRKTLVITWRIFSNRRITISFFYM